LNSFYFRVIDPRYIQGESNAEALDKYKSSSSMWTGLINSLRLVIG